jgi:alpha/beta superfamily hydrolase
MISVSSEQVVFIPGPAGVLEGILQPVGDSGHQAVVICHPHPLQGGTMNNKVVTTLARTWRDAGVSTLRFNFRGTGASEGQHAQGVGEIDDLLAALDWLQRRGVQAVSLAGFSFGAWVAAAGALRLPPGLRLERLALVAPPVQYTGFSELQPPAGTIVLQGEEDDVVDPLEVRNWVESRRQQPELVLFDGAGHFFHGRLTALKAELTARLGNQH